MLHRDTDFLKKYNFNIIVSVGNFNNTAKHQSSPEHNTLGGLL